MLRLLQTTARGLLTLLSDMAQGPSLSPSVALRSMLPGEMVWAVQEATRLQVRIHTISKTQSTAQDKQPVTGQTQCCTPNSAFFCRGRSIT